MNLNLSLADLAVSDLKIISTHDIFKACIVLWTVVCFCHPRPHYQPHREYEIFELRQRRGEMSSSLQRGQLAVGGCEHSIRKSSIIFNEGGVCCWGEGERGVTMNSSSQGGRG